MDEARRPISPRARPAWSRPRPPSRRPRPPSIRRRSTSITPSSARRSTASSIDRSVDVGQTLAASVQSPVLFRIAADLTRMQVQVNVDESDVGRHDARRRRDLRGRVVPNETFHGTLSQVRLQPVAQLTTTATTLPTSDGSPASTTRSPRSSATPRSSTSRIPTSACGRDDGRSRASRLAAGAGGSDSQQRAVVSPAAGRPARARRDRADATPSGATQAAGDPKLRQVWEYDGKQFTSDSRRGRPGRRWLDGAPERRRPRGRCARDRRRIAASSSALATLQIRFGMPRAGALTTLNSRCTALPETACPASRAGVRLHERFA